MKRILSLTVIVIFSVMVLFSCAQKEKVIQYKVPQWAKKAVWYQIFPERFCNGDSANDPVIEDIIGSWPFGDERPMKVTPWTDDWYKLQPWEKIGKGFFYHVQRRRYGGDLQGVLDRLDYIQELGINAIYFNPVFESPSLHKYDGTCYHHIDDNFGPDPAGDKKIMAEETPDNPATWQWTAADKLFLKLLEECHKRDIRVIIDGVLNHIGVNFFAFVDLKKNQQQSRYKNWFNVEKWDDPETETDEFKFQCWANYVGMPEIREDENGFDNEAWKYMEASIKRWMDPNNDGDPSDGIDGWRLDVAEKVTRPSWVKFRKLVRTINPEAYLTGEVWWEKWPEKMFNASPWLQGDMFDAVMNYRFTAAVTKFFIDQEKKISATEFDQELAQVRLDYPEDVNYVLQNLMSSHDTDRLSSMIINPDRIFGHQNQVKDNRKYNVRKPKSHEIKVQKLIALFQMTYLGAPMIYYGDEAGMWGASDPDERKPMLWPEMKFADEVNHPYGLSRPKDKNEFNLDLFNYYKEIIRIRKEHPALMLGDYKKLIANDEKSIYVFERNYAGEKIIVVINNSDRIQPLNLKVSSEQWFELLSGDRYIGIDGSIELKIDSKAGLILAAASETKFAQNVK